MNKYNRVDVSKALTERAAIEFDKLKDKMNLSYEEDFRSFALGYTMGIAGTIKTIKNVGRE